ncbi:GNAT family N-acetyltransferase [Seonamhaeicola sp. ML3]|uniref:GNAT family N-acetyltransferase n=1 Tax=Seonamhaeicola sp. ML3 TaxID=2937786 RepID=UPI0020102818|nr:GNAT family protein [Seonamhaeicola sp. ML3]
MLFSSSTFKINPINTQDAWNICNFVNANEDRLRRYFPKTLAQNLNPDLSKFYVDKKVNQFNKKELFLFTLKPKDTNKIIGLIFLKEINWNKKQGEFAYCIHYENEGQGITTKSINFLSNYAFNEFELKTLQIIVHKDNISSKKVAENCNFTWIKTLEKEYTPPGEAPLDMELYELYKEVK